MSRLSHARQDVLARTRNFWDHNPCDGQDNIRERMHFRYDKEPWLTDVLSRVAKHGSILEIGCGQGTDAVTCCRQLSPGASYTGIDLSGASIHHARAAAQEAAESLAVTPRFEIGNAEDLPFADGQFDCVVSLGVLHHTASLEAALSEIRRVLAPGGSAYISLYRTFSPKLMGAIALRSLCRGLERVLHREGWTLQLARNVGSSHFLGTMLHECVGVPVLNSYTKAQLTHLFRHFHMVDINPVGLGFSCCGLNRYHDRCGALLGAQWLVEAKTPGGQA